MNGRSRSRLLLRVFLPAAMMDPPGSTFEAGSQEGKSGLTHSHFLS